LKKRCVHRVYVGRPEGNKPLGSLRHVWADNIRMHIKETVWEVMDCIHLAQDWGKWQAVVGTVRKLCVLKSRGIY
jgi:hypothetical protein